MAWESPLKRRMPVCYRDKTKQNSAPKLRRFRKKKVSSLTRNIPDFLQAISANELPSTSVCSRHRWVTTETAGALIHGIWYR